MPEQLPILYDEYARTPRLRTIPRLSCSSDASATYGVISYLSLASTVFRMLMQVEYECI